MASSESQSFLLKKPLKAKTISEVMCQYPVVIWISRYNKIAGFWQQNIHSNRYHGVCHVIYILFGSYFLLKAMYSKFCCSGICVTDFMYGAVLLSGPLEWSWQSSSWIGLLWEAKSGVSSWDKK